MKHDEDELGDHLHEIDSPERDQFCKSGGRFGCIFTTSASSIGSRAMQAKPPPQQARPASQGAYPGATALVPTAGQRPRR